MANSVKITQLDFLLYILTLGDMIFSPHEIYNKICQVQEYNCITYQ